MALAPTAYSGDIRCMNDAHLDPSRLVIRRGEPADAAALAAFGARTFLDTFGPANDAAHIRAYLDDAFNLAQQTGELADPDTTVLLGSLGGALVAYAQMRRSPVPACVAQVGAIELQRFYLDRAVHGSGTASKLMQAVHTAAAALGAGHIWLGVWEHNPRAIAFYAKCGYVDVGSKTFDVGPDRQTDRVMVAPVAVTG